MKTACNSPVPPAIGSIEKPRPEHDPVTKLSGNPAVRDESFDSLAVLWRDPGTGLRWDCLFVIPIWLEAWWSVFGPGWTRNICSVRRGEDLLGIAPLMVRDRKAYIIGDSDVCDCLDFVVVPGRESVFFETLMDHLRCRGIIRMDLHSQRRGSVVHRHLLPLLEREGFSFSWEQEGVTYDMELPATWEAFLVRLTGKQRHEVRRKMRRVHEAGHLRVRKVHEEKDIEAGLVTFFDLFSRSRKDKAAFMTGERKKFFQAMTAALAEARLLRLYVCELGGHTATAVMCFDYGSTRYLYNNGYDPRFGSLSVGIVSKLLTIKDGIDTGRRRYDFLKGSESYKRHLGGKPAPLYGLSVELR